MADNQLQRSLTNAQLNGSRTDDWSVGVTIADLTASWERHLRAAGRSDRTIGDYLTDVQSFAAWAGKQGMPADVANLTREHIEAWQVHQFDAGRAAMTVLSRHRRLKQYFKWCAEEGEIPGSPMANMSPPDVAEKPVPLIGTDHIKALLKACEGPHHPERRDMAIIRMLIDTGGRRSEISALTVDDIDWTNDQAHVVGKGRGGGKERSLPLGAKTMQALDRYWRVRRRHKRAAERWLWLGQRGRFGYWGIGQMLEVRAEQAGIERVTPHQFRHTFSHRWLASGGTEGDLMRLNGWSSREMLDRYARSAADERAREAHRRMALGDDL